MMKHNFFLVKLLLVAAIGLFCSKVQAQNFDNLSYPLTDSQLAQLQKIHATAKKSNNYDLFTQATKNLIKHYRLKTEFREVFIVSDEYLQKMLGCQETDRIADAYYLVGVAYFNSGLPSYALDYFLKMEDLPLDLKRQAKVNYALGETSRSIEKNQGLDPSKYYRTCEKIARQLNDSSLVALALFGQSQLFFDSMGGYKLDAFSEGVMDSLAKSTHFLEEAVLNLKENNVSFMAGLSCNYAAMKRYEKALSWKPEIEANRDDPDYTALTFNCLAAIDNYMGNWDESISLCKQAIEHARKFDRMIDEHHATDILAYAYKGKGDYQNAVQCMIRVRKMENDMRSKENDVELMAMQVKFDLKEKEDQIIRHRNYFLFTLGVCGLLFAALVIWFYYYRLLSKKNKAIVAQVLEQNRLMQIHRDTDNNMAAIDISETETDNNGNKASHFYRLNVYLQENKRFLNENLNSNELARELHTNYKYLQNAIRSCVNMSFGEYINSLRLQHACTLLADKHNRETIDSIAANCGFNNRISFYRLFMEKYGISPSEFRKNAK